MTPEETAKRRPARYPFTARVVIHEPSAERRVIGLTTDVSEGGCCVRAEEVFARGTKIELEIVKENVTLQVQATVAFGVPPNVMGLTFGEMDEEKSQILARWIENAVPRMSRYMGRDEAQLPSTTPMLPLIPDKPRS